MDEEDREGSSHFFQEDTLLERRHAHSIGHRNEETLGNVLLVPSVTKNLLSVEATIEKDLKLEFEGIKFLIRDPKNHYKVIAKGKKYGKLFKLEGFSSAFSTRDEGRSTPLSSHKVLTKEVHYAFLNRQLE
ncbi:hypothetical protein GOP47_0013240 [Adiantum capillus-veneris]|uniref:Uncharacterized protein n=1 Tax=Adiantum capillus-veneris TaxID=13818 RepID=A0A9D4ZD88_ADICA|nr:hypothetical protein GOP47_0013240 [Adiantum capillus-veneris]